MNKTSSNMFYRGCLKKYLHKIEIRFRTNVYSQVQSQDQHLKFSPESYILFYKVFFDISVLETL